MRRLLGAILCFFLISSSASAIYAECAGQDFFTGFQLERSYFSLDPMDDFADTDYPDGVVNSSAREKITPKLSLGAKVRRARFTTMAFQGPAHSLSSHQDLYRYQEVFRI